MQWKYCELEVEEKMTLDNVLGKLTVLNSDGKHFTRKDDYMRIMAQLGDEGWELIGMATSKPIGYSGIRYVFKMPMEEYNRLTGK